VLPYNKNLVELAKELRKNMTPAERCLWQKLRRISLGCMFFRQKPIGEYIVDFYSPRANLIIEVDGEIHLGIQAKDNDKLRDEYMRSLEQTVLRFKNSEVLSDTERVVEKIVSQIRLNPPLKGRTNQRIAV
jgi:very-short-patch-repair endonuclease